VIPALLAVWVRLGVKESPIWEATRRADQAEGQEERPGRNPLVEMFSGELRTRAVLVSIKMAAILFVLWGILAWLPTVLASPPRNLSTARSMEYVLVFAAGNLVGQILMGFLMDRIGRKKAFMLTFALGAIMLLIYPNVLDLETLFYLGFLMGMVVFAPMGGIAAYTGELFPTRMRGTAINWGMGFGRGVSIIAPIFLAALAPSMGLGGAFVTLAAFYVVAFLAVLGLPETKGTEFQPG
jgi:MFS family permease